jgi:phosphonoacetate hydrolase
MPVRTVAMTVNGREYQLSKRPLAVICIDGSADEYFNAALVRGRMPNLQKIAVEGFRGMARAALPSFTNVNNTSIVTGVPPSVHGIPGNFFFDPAAKEEVMMNSARYLRCETILAAAVRAGRKVGVVTAKEKLRDIFSAGVAGNGKASGLAFSSEKASEAKKETHGINGVEQLVGAPTPAIYSGEASLYVLRAGAALLETGKTDFLYLSTTDFMQHLHEPEAAESLDFYAGIDEQIARVRRAGAVIGITADHGMNAKQKADGSPNVIYLESALTKRFGGGFRVILPITDPYVAHHGALGSFAVVHLPEDMGREKVMNFLLEMQGVTEVWERETAASKLELPLDRLGDIVVLSGRDVVLGRTPDYHDLKALKGGLRSHGGRYEEMVPFVISEPLNAVYKRRALGDIRNFDIFDFTINGVRSA